MSGSSNSNETSSTKRIYDLEQKIDSINNRLTQFASCIMQLQSNINNQPRRGKLYNSNSYYQGQSVKVQPIPEESLASRLGVTPESLRKERESQPAALFLLGVSVKILLVLAGNLMRKQICIIQLLNFNKTLFAQIIYQLSN
ncbi:MAG: hypothetical protein ACR2LR_01425 [Hassallia sp.]